MVNLYLLVNILYLISVSQLNPDSLKPGQDYTTIASKVINYTRFNLTFKTFLTRVSFIFTRAFIIYMFPVLDYIACLLAWSRNQKQYKDILKNVQGTSLLPPCIEPVYYINKPTFLGLKQLELRHLHADLILMVKLTNNIASSTLSNALHFANNTHTIERAQV